MGPGLWGKGCSDTAHGCPCAVPQLAASHTTDLNAKPENKNPAAQGNIAVEFLEGKQGKLSTCKCLINSYILRWVCVNTVCMAALPGTGATWLL